MKMSRHKFCLAVRRDGEKEEAQCAKKAAENLILLQTQEINPIVTQFWINYIVYHFKNQLLRFECEPDG